MYNLSSLHSYLSGDTGCGSISIEADRNMDQHSFDISGSCNHVIVCTQENTSRA